MRWGRLWRPACCDCTTMRKIVYFSGESARRRRKRKIHPANAIVGTGRVGRGRGKGGGVLLARVTALFLGEGTRRVTMEIAPWCGAIYCIFGRGGSIFTPWGRQTTGFRDVVARASNTPVRLRRQNRDHIVSSSRNISHRGQFRRRWCSTILSRGGVSVRL